MTPEPQVPAGPEPVDDGMDRALMYCPEPDEDGNVRSKRSRWQDLPRRALELFLALPRRVQYALAVALLGGGARLSGADAAVLSLLFPSAPSAPEARAGRCSGLEPAGVDEELRDMEALER